MYGRGFDKRLPFHGHGNHQIIHDYQIVHDYQFKIKQLLLPNWQVNRYDTII